MSNLTRKMWSTVRHGAHEFHIAVIGDYGAIQFHFWTFTPEEPWRKFSSLGVEFHRRVQSEDANRPVCDLLDGMPCNHYGTSLWASERVMPAFEAGGSDAVYEILERRYQERIEDYL